MDITKKLTAFYHHLNEDEVDRSFLSVKLGDAITEFLNKFKEKYSNQYSHSHLSITNLQQTNRLLNTSKETCLHNWF